jgi:hypothetical protein
VDGAVTGEAPEGAARDVHVLGARLVDVDARPLRAGRETDEEGAASRGLGPGPVEAVDHDAVADLALLGVADVDLEE